MKAISFLAAGIGLLFSAESAMGLHRGGNTYFEICVSAQDCAVGVVSTTTGEFGVLVPESRALPGGMLLGDIFKNGPGGTRIARIRDASYQDLKRSGLERLSVNPENIQDEIDKIQGEINDSLTDCLLATAGCTGGGLLALGTGPLGLAVAGVVCWQSYRQCKTLDKANQDLFAQRKALQDKLKEQAKEKEGQEGGDTAGGGGGGESSGPPSTGSGSGIPEVPLPGSSITITEGRPGAGGGGGTGKPIILN